MSFVVAAFSNIVRITKTAKIARTTNTNPLEQMDFSVRLASHTGSPSVVTAEVELKLVRIVRLVLIDVAASSWLVACVGVLSQYA